jgi:hypothetical protein
VIDRVREQLGRSADDPRDVPRRIDDGVPAPALERAQVAVAVAAQVLRLGVELRAGAAAVEERQLVAGRKRGLRNRAPEELRAAEEEELQSSASAASSPSTSCAVL